MSEPPPSAAPQTTRKSRFWHWLKRGLLVFLGLLVLAGVFHRQLLQWGLNWGAAYFAKREGYTLEWKLDGSMLSDLKVKELKIRGPEGGVVVNVELKDASLKYDLWKLWREGTGKFLKELSLADTTIEVDVRTNPDKPAPPPKIRQKKPPPDFWVERLNLQNISAIIHTDQGDVVLRGLTLLLDEKEPGTLAIQELIVPSAQIHLNDVLGRTALKGRKLTLADLRVTPEVKIPRLYTDLEKLHRGAADYDLTVLSGEGSLTSKGRVEGLGTEPSVNNSLKVTNLAHTEIERWTRLPAGFAARIDNADIKVKGIPTKPQELHAEVVLEVSGLRVAGYGCDTAQLLGTIKAGAMHVGTLKAQSGPNQVQVSGTVPLPPAWSGLAKITTQAQWQIAAPDLSAVRESPVALAGSLQGTGTLDLREGKLTGATASLNGTALKLPQIELAAFQADVTTDADVVKMNAISLRLDAAGNNTARVSGQMQIGGRQTTALQVQADFKDLAGTMRALGRSEGPLPEAGTATATVSAKFDLADLKEKDFSKALVQGKVRLDGVRMQEGSLDDTTLDLTLQDGKATLAALLDPTSKNHAAVHGEMLLSGRQPGKVTWEVELADLPTLMPLAGDMDQPPPEAGSVSSRGSATFDLEDLRAKDYTRVAAQGYFHINGLKWREGLLTMATVEARLNDGKGNVTAVLDPTGRNNAVISANIDFAGAQPVTANWQLNLADLATLLPLAGMTDTPPPEAGTIKSNGSASFTLTDLKAKSYTKIVAQTSTRVEGLRWRKGVLNLATVDAQLRDGKSTFSARLDPAGKNNATIDGEVQLTGNQPAKVSWQLSLADLATLVPLAGLQDTPPPSSGVVSSTGAATFEIADLKAKNFTKAAGGGSLTIDDLVWQKGKLERVQGDFALKGGMATLDQFFIRFDEKNQLTAQGRTPLDFNQPFEAEVHGRMTQLTSLSPWLAMAKVPVISSGQVELDWKGTGRIATKDIVGGGSVKVRNLKLAGRADAYDLALTTKHEGRRAEVTELKASAGKFRAEATASVSETDLSVPTLILYSGNTKLLDGTVQVPLALSQVPRPAMPVDPARPIRIQLKMQKLDFAQLYEVIGKKAPVEGAITADVDLQGTLADLQGKIAAEMTGVRAEALQGKLEPASAQLNLQIVRNQLMLQTTVGQKPLQPLTIKASLPFNAEAVMKNPNAILDAPLDAEVVLPPSNLDVVPRFVPALAKLTGTVGMNVKIGGTARKPSWTGTLRTDVTRLALEDVPMDIKDVKANLAFKDSRIELSDVSATVAGGRVRLGGTVDATNIKDPAFDLRLVADQALLVRDNTMSFRADADVGCRGTLAKSAVTGRVELVRGRVFKEVEFLPLSLPNSLPPPPPSMRAGKSGPPAAPAILKDWTFDVTIVTKDPIRMLGNVLNGAVVVNTHVGGTGAALAIEGKATMDGARLQLPFSRLTVTRGGVIFNKSNPFDPAIDIQGDSLINNYQVTVFAYGSARDPKVRLTSSPPLPENEIASLLATGSTSGDSGSAEGVAANRAAFLLVSQTYRKLFNKAAPKRRLDEEPSKLTFSFNPLSTGRTEPSVTATYEVNPNLQASGTFGGSGFRGLLYYLVRFR